MPDDVVVFGLGNSIQGRLNDPPLSTVACRYDDMEQIGGGDFTPRHVLLPFELLLRDGAEPCRRRG